MGRAVDSHAQDRLRGTTEAGGERDRNPGKK